MFAYNLHYPKCCPHQPTIHVMVVVYAQVLDELDARDRRRRHERARRAREREEEAAEEEEQKTYS